MKNTSFDGSLLLEISLEIMRIARINSGWLEILRITWLDRESLELMRMRPELTENLLQLEDFELMRITRIDCKLLLKLTRITRINSELLELMKINGESMWIYRRNKLKSIEIFK